MKPSRSAGVRTQTLDFRFGCVEFVRPAQNQAQQADAENGGELHGFPLANVAPHRASLIQHALWFRNPVRKNSVELMRGSQTQLVLAATMAATVLRHVINLLPFITFVLVLGGINHKR